MSTNGSKHEVECQTLLQCSPHILGKEEIAIVQSDATSQTLVTFDPNNSNTELYPLLSYTKPEEIQKDAVRSYGLPRIPRLQFILPEGHIDKGSVAQMEHSEDEIGQDDPVQEQPSDSTEPVNYCEVLQKLIAEKEEQKKENVESPGSSVRSSIDREETPIQSILKHTNEEDPARKRRRRVKITDADCQTNLMVAPHILLPCEMAIVTCELSVQTSVTCHPQCSVSDILPKLKSYLVHEGRQAEPTAGDNKDNASVLDLIKGLLDNVEYCHSHMFDPIPQELSQVQAAYSVNVETSDSHSTTKGIKQDKVEPIVTKVIKQEELKPEDHELATSKQVKIEKCDYKLEKVDSVDNKNARIKVENEEPIDDKFVKEEIKTGPIECEKSFHDTSDVIKKEEDEKAGIIKTEEVPELNIKSEIKTEIKPEIKTESEHDNESEVIKYIREWIHSNIVNNVDITETDSDENIYSIKEEIEELITYLTERVLQDTKSENVPSIPPAPKSTTVPSYNINVYFNNFIGQSTNVNEGLLNTSFQLNICPCDKVQPLTATYEKSKTGNINQHEIAFIRNCDGTQTEIFDSNEQEHRKSDSSESLNEESLTEIQHPLTSSREKLDYISNVCDNVRLQNCPNLNVYFDRAPNVGNNLETENKHNQQLNEPKKSVDLKESCYAPCAYHNQDSASEILERAGSRPELADNIMSSTTVIIPGKCTPGQVAYVSTVIVTKSSKTCPPSKIDPQVCQCAILPGTDNLEPHKETQPLNMLVDTGTDDRYIETYMQELEDVCKCSDTDDEVVIPRTTENKNELIYNHSCTACYIEPYTIEGYAFVPCNGKDGTDLALGFIVCTSPNYISQKESLRSGLDRCDSKPELPWDVLNLPLDIKIITNKSKSETDIIRKEIQERSQTLLQASATKSLIFEKTCINSKPYVKKLIKEYPLEERSKIPCISETEIAWSKILLPTDAKIQKIVKQKSVEELGEVSSSKSLQCICKSGYVLPIRVHRNIDLLCRNVQSSQNEEDACYESTNIVVILPPRSRHFISTKFPVDPEHAPSLTQTNLEGIVNLELCSSLSEKKLKPSGSKKTVTFGSNDSRTNTSKNRNKKISSKSEPSLQSCKSSTQRIPKSKGPQVVPLVKKSSSRKSRTSHICIKLTKSKSLDNNVPTCAQLVTPATTTSKISKHSKIQCDPCNTPTEIITSLSNTSLKVKQDPVFMTMSTCETEFKPIKQAFGKVQEKLKHINMPEPDCMFNNKPIYTNTLQCGGNERLKINAGYKLDQSNQGTFKYNSMNSNGMYNQYNSFGGNVSSTLSYSHTSNTFAPHNAMQYPQNDMYYSCQLQGTSSIPSYRGQYQNYYSLPDSKWIEPNYRNNLNFPSPPESISSKYSVCKCGQHDRNTNDRSKAKHVSYQSNYDVDFRHNINEPDYISSQYSFRKSDKRESHRDRSRAKHVPCDHKYKQDPNPYFDDQSSCYCNDHARSEDYSRNSSRHRDRCYCKTASKIRNKKKKSTSQSKINVKSSDSNCPFIDVLKTLFTSDQEHGKKQKTPRFTSKDIEKLRVHLQFHSKHD